MNVSADTIVVIVLLKYSRTLVAENPVSLSFSEMAYKRRHWLAMEPLQISWERVYFTYGWPHSPPSVESNKSELDDDTLPLPLTV